MKQNTTNLVPTLQKEASTLVKQATALTITSQRDMEQATTHLSTINLRLDTIKTERTKVTVPLNQALKAEHARWKPIETELEDARDIIRKTMSLYQTEQKALTDKAAAEIAARIKPGKGNLSPEKGVSKIAELDTPQQEVVTEVGSVNFRTVKQFEIEAYSLLPQKVIDEVLYRAKQKGITDSVVRELMQQGEQVPGVRYYETQEPYNTR